MADNSALPPGLENTAIIQGRTGTNKSENGALSTTDFLKFILSRIQQQDPLKHMENNQFLNPLAQFCAINGITDLKTAFDRFSTSLQSNHALLASTMVGRLALVAGDMVNLNAGSGAQGAVDLAASTGNLLVSISDASGQVLRTINLGSQPAGIVHFVWDGLTEAGRTAAPGTYTFTAQVFVENEMVAQPTYLQARVDSVTLAQTDVGPILNLQGLGPVPITRIKEIN